MGKKFIEPCLIQRLSNLFDHGILPNDIFLPGYYEKDEVQGQKFEKLESVVAEALLFS